NPLLVAPQAVYEQGFTRQASTPLGPIVWVSEPALIKTVLLDRGDAFPKSPLEKRLLGPLFGRNSMMMSEGAEWKWQRQTAAPLFRHAELLGFIPMMNQAAEETIAQWRAGAPGSVRDVESDTARTTFRAMCDAMLYGGKDYVGKIVERAQNDY